MNRFASLSDPMVRLLLLAVVLAAFLPSTGRLLAVVQAVSTGSIFILFMINGLRIDRRELASGLRRLDYFVPLTIWTFGVMSLFGLGFAQLSQGLLPPIMALGFLYLGTLPSTVQSATSYTMLGGGSVALSIIGAAFINILGVFVTAPLFALLGGGEVADVGLETIVRIVALLIVPLMIGLFLQDRTREWVETNRANLVWVDRIVIALAVYVAFSGAVDADIWSRVSGEAWAWLAGLVCAFLAIAHGFAWVTAGMLKFDPRERVAFLFGASQKSVAIGAPLAALLFAPEDAGFVIVPLLLYHLAQLVIAAPIAAKTSSWIADRSGGSG